MDSLIAAAIHDAKNSLNALGVWLDKAKHEFATAQGKSGAVTSPALERASAITTTLTGQLVELLALYRDGDGTLRLSVEDHDLTDFLTDIVSEVKHSHPEESGIAIETDFSAAAEVGTWAFDAYLVNFALLDAVRNSLRHARTKVRFSIAHSQDEGIRFTIEDDGEGYPAAMLGSESGADEDALKAMNSESSGLGLRFARMIVARHATPGGKHGRLEFANDGFGQGGARFSLTLP